MSIRPEECPSDGYNTLTSTSFNASRASRKSSVFFVALLLMIGAVLPFVDAATTNSTIIVSGTDLRVSLVNQDPDPAAIGDVVELRVGIANQGQKQRTNLVVEAIPSYPFTALAGESLIGKINTLGGYQVDVNQQIVKFKLGVDPKALAGTYNIKIWTYNEGDRGTHTETTIPIIVDSRKNVQVIYVDKTVIIPGQETPVTFTINNVGKSELNNLEFSWKNDDGVLLPVSGTAGRYIDSLGVGKSVNLSYVVIASTSASADLYPLELTLSYDDPSGNGQNTFTTVAGIYVGGTTDFDVSFGSSSNGQMSFNVANTGSNSANAVAVTIPQQDGWRVTGTKTSMIGSLSKGDYTIASFNLVSVGKEQQPLKINVVYTDTKGERHTNSYMVDVNSNAAANSTMMGARTGTRSTSTTSTGFFTTPVIIGLIVVAAVIGGIFYFRKNSSKPKR